mmetsp:Transcript_95095/g.295758  ORF Transcript_95095/g.295758 Transcript_95095/m.295758 type:complete len:629 (+) Transcript_95095:940-2826(+)
MGPPSAAALALEQALGGADGAQRRAVQHRRPVAGARLQLQLHVRVARHGHEDAAGVLALGAEHGARGHRRQLRRGQELVGGLRPQPLRQSLALGPPVLAAGQRGVLRLRAALEEAPLRLGQGAGEVVLHAAELRLHVPAPQQPLVTRAEVAEHQAHAARLAEPGDLHEVRAGGVVDALAGEAVQHQRLQVRQGPDDLLEVLAEGDGDALEEEAREAHHLRLVAVLPQHSPLFVGMHFCGAEVRARDVVLEHLQLREADVREDERQDHAQADARGEALVDADQKHAVDDGHARPLEPALHQPRPVHEHAAAHDHEEAAQEELGQVRREPAAGDPDQQAAGRDERGGAARDDGVVPRALLAERGHARHGVHGHAPEEAHAHGGQAQALHLAVGAVGRRGRDGLDGADRQGTVDAGHKDQGNGMDVGKGLPEVRGGPVHAPDVQGPCEAGPGGQEPAVALQVRQAPACREGPAVEEDEAEDDEQHGGKVRGHAVVLQADADARHRHPYDHGQAALALAGPQDAQRALADRGADHRQEAGDHGVRQVAQGRGGAHPAQEGEEQAQQRGARVQRHAGRGQPRGLRQVRLRHDAQHAGEEERHGHVRRGHGEGAVRHEAHAADGACQREDAGAH